MTSPLQIRPVERRDDLPILQALVKAKKAATGVKEWVDDYDIPDGEQILTAIIDGVEVTSVIINETYLYCYRVGQPWWGTPGTNMEECLVLRIYNTQETFGCIVEAQMKIAQEAGCLRLHVQTDFANSDAVQKKYQQHGFKVEGVKLSKGVPHG